MTAPLEIMERLKSLPEHLQPHNRRFYVEAITDETKAPFITYYAQQSAAEKAAHQWAKDHGAVGFFPPSQNGTGANTVYAFAFNGEPEPKEAWTKAGRNFQTQPGHTAAYPSKRPAGKALTEELAQLPSFPSHHEAFGHLNPVTDLNTQNQGRGVGHSDNKWHFSVPFTTGTRYFASIVNHNYDISRLAEEAARLLAGDHPEWAPSLDFKGDPIAWRLPEGWAFRTKAEVDFIIAEENLRRAKGLQEP